MPVALASTFWKCPECGEVSVIDGTELSEVGTPYCDCQEEQEMEPMDDPIPTVLYVDDEEDKILVGVALRPADVSPDDFKAKIAKLYEKWLKKHNPPFAEWLEDKHDILFLQAESLTVQV